MTFEQLRALLATYGHVLERDPNTQGGFLLSSPEFPGGFPLPLDSLEKANRVVEDLNLPSHPDQLLKQASMLKQASIEGEIDWEGDPIVWPEELKEQVSANIAAQQTIAAQQAAATTGPRIVGGPGGGMFYERGGEYGGWEYVPPGKVPAEVIPAEIITGEELGAPGLEGRLFIRQPDGSIRPYEEPGYEAGPTIDQQIADLLVQEGKMASALKLWEFKNQMTPYQRQALELQSRQINQQGLQQALEISRSPADFFTLMQLQSGAAPIQQPGYTGAFRGIGPRGSQTITNLFERLGLIAPPAAPGVDEQARALADEQAFVKAQEGPMDLVGLDEMLRRQQADEDRARRRLADEQAFVKAQEGPMDLVGLDEMLQAQQAHQAATQFADTDLVGLDALLQAQQAQALADAQAVEEAKAGSMSDVASMDEYLRKLAAEEKVTFRGGEVDPFSTQRRQFTPPVILGPGDIPQPLAPSGVVDLGASVTPPGASVTPPGAPWVLGDVPQPYGLAPTDVGGGYQFTQAPMGSLGKKYAGGGIVRGPTLATLGETGPEMVVPLDPRKRAQAENLVNIYRRLTANDIPSFAEGGMVFNPKQAAQLGQSAKALTGGALAMKYGKGTGGWDPSGKVFKMSFGPAPTSVLQKYNLAPKVTSVSDKPITTASKPGVTGLGGGTVMPWQQVEKMFQKAAPPPIPQAPGGSPTAPYATPATGTPTNIPKGVGAGLTPETFLKKQAPNIYKVGVLGQAIGAPKQLSPLAGVTLPSMQAWRQFTPTERETFLAAVEATGIPRATFLREAGLTTFQPAGIPRGRTVRMQQQSLGGRTYT